MREEERFNGSRQEVSGRKDEKVSRATGNENEKQRQTMSLSDRNTVTFSRSMHNTVCRPSRSSISAANASITGLNGSLITQRKCCLSPLLTLCEAQRVSGWMRTAGIYFLHDAEKHEGK